MSTSSRTHEALRSEREPCLHMAGRAPRLGTPRNPDEPRNLDIAARCQGEVRDCGGLVQIDPARRASARADRNQAGNPAVE
jgi:hypothetical protein